MSLSALLAPICPIIGVATVDLSQGDPWSNSANVAIVTLADGSTARIDFDSSATTQQRAAAITAASGYNPLKDTLKAYASSARYAKETGGITINGVAIDTGRQALAMITSAFNFLQQNPSETIQWKAQSGFTTLNAAAITAIANAVGAHVQACFAEEATVDAQIDAGTITTTAAIDAAFAGVTT